MPEIRQKGRAMKTTYQYDHYYQYEELTGILEGYEKEYPDYCRLESVGEASSGRKIWLMSVTKLAAGDFADKPAYGVHANIHAGEVTGTMCAMYFLDYLLTNRYLEQDLERMLGMLAAKIPDPKVLDGVRIMNTARESYLKRLLDTVTETYGSMDEFLKTQMGIGQEERRILRERYLM